MHVTYPLCAHFKVYSCLNFLEAMSYQCLILSSEEGLILNFFKKMRGHLVIRPTMDSQIQLELIAVLLC